MSAHPPADAEPDAKRARVALAPGDEGVRKARSLTPVNGEGAEEEEEVVEVSIDGDGDGDGGEDDVGGITEAMQAEEQRLHDEREEMDKEWREEQTKAFKSELALEGKKKKTAIEQRVKRLNDLLERSIVYSVRRRARGRGPGGRVGEEEEGQDRGAHGSGGPSDIPPRPSHQPRPACHCHGRPPPPPHRPSPPLSPLLPSSSP